MGLTTNPKIEYLNGGYIFKLPLRKWSKTSSKLKIEKNSSFTSLINKKMIKIFFKYVKFLGKYRFMIKEFEKNSSFTLIVNKKSDQNFKK